mmetsp:Transcript_80456/g.98550  ORF Transcript_80456/g.98550 Transcript_80456/m.98550 type:complete len:233 (-) Transcript_80456:137-835(-)
MENQSLILLCPCLRLFHLHSQSCFCHIHRKAGLPHQFCPYSMSRPLCFHLLLILCEAMGNQLCSTVDARHIQGGQVSVHCHGHLVQTPTALEANCLLVDDQQELELAGLHRLVKQGLRRILTNLTLLLQQSTRKGPGPVGVVSTQPSGGCMLSNTFHKTFDRCAPPVAQKPGRRLGLARHHLNEGTTPWLCDRLNQIVAKVVKIEEVNSQRLSGCFGHLGRKVINPCGAVFL